MAWHGMMLLHIAHAQGHGLGHGKAGNKETSAVSLPAKPVILLHSYATARRLGYPVILLPTATTDASRFDASRFNGSI